MITKKAALDRFINERVLGERGFAITDGGTCTYDHRINGGCEIGQYLPEEFARNADGSYGTGLLGWDYSKRVCSETFEDYESPFWSWLQRAHDNLAAAHRQQVFSSVYPPEPTSFVPAWGAFESSLRAAAERC